MDPQQILNQLLLLLTGHPTVPGQPGTQSLAEFLPQCIGIVVVLFIAYLAARFLRQVVARGLANTKTEAHTTGLIGNLVFYGVLGIGALWAFGGFGLSLALVALGLSFGAKDLIENFAAGLLIMVTRPFAVGDWIQISGIEGKVADLSWRATLLDTLDGRRVILPNIQVINNPVTNNSTHPMLRSVIPVLVDTRTDLRRAEKIILDALAPIADLVADPKPDVLVVALTGPTVTLNVRLWTRSALQRQPIVMSDALRAIKEAFEQNSIAVAPQHQLALLDRPADSSPANENPPSPA